jgi:putative ABC transport system permease protein
MDWKSRVRSALTTSSSIPDEDVVEELAQHLDALYATARADGLSHAEAESRASAELHNWRLQGSALQHRQRRPPVIVPPPIASSSHLSGFAQDVRYALRLLRRQPRYTALAVLTMALGISATTVLFSLTYGLLMKPLPWPGSERLVVVSETRGGSPPRFGSFSNAAYLAWREEARTVEEIGAWSPRTVTIAGTGDPERIRIADASASLFRVLSAHALIGTLFDEQDERSTNGAVIVLSESLWRQRFGSDPAALGQLARIDGQTYRIIGVLPDAVSYPDRQTRAWVPYRVMPATGNSLSMFNAIARLRAGMSAQQAASEGTVRGRLAVDTGLTTMAIFGGRGPIQISAVPLRESMTSGVRRPLLILLAAVVLLLVTSTANVASLQLVRTSARRREMGIRAALGAGSARVTRQLLVESLVLGLIGGGLGLALAWLLHRVMPALLPADFPRVDHVGVDSTVILFTLVITVLASVSAGVLPALRVYRLNLVGSLTEEGTLRPGGRSRTARARLSIMAGQVAIACVLLVGASLLGRSFIALLAVDRGYDPSGVLTARLALPGTMYTPERRYSMLGHILERLEALPAVLDASFTSELPLTPGGSTSAFTMRSRATAGAVTQVQASPRIVSPRYFSTVGLRLIEGRSFGDGDTETSQPVVIVNRAFARQYLGDSTLGATLPMGLGYQGASTEPVDATVIGVVDDVRYVTTTEPTHPEMYYSYRQFRGRLAVTVVTLLVRTEGGPATLAAALRTAVREADGGLVPEAVMSMEDRMLVGLARPRLYAILLGGFAGFALLVAAVGLFGVLSYSVAERSRELAVRVALGARRIDLARLVLTQGLAVTCAGLAVGLPGSFALTRTMEALLYGVTARDGFTYLAVPLILVAVATVAALGPAYRAARLDPMTILRQ